MGKGSLDTHGLEQECYLYTSYLIEWGADRYVVDKYREAHTVSEIFRNSEYQRLDTVLVAISLQQRFLTKLVDVYTRIVYPTCLVRKKWILLLGILETYGPSHSYFEITDSGGKARLCLRALAKGLEFIVLAAISIVVLMPVHVACAVQQKYFMRKP